MEEKPPVGVCPAFVRSNQRIEELAEGIIRYARNGYTSDNTQYIKVWANEIIIQCEIIAMEQKERATSQ